MGCSKLTLPWGTETVIERVVRTLLTAGCAPVVVVTGGWRAEVEAALRDWPVRCVYNAAHADGAMLRSLQHGLAALDAEPQVAATLVALGDQPLIPASVPRALTAAWRRAPQALWHPVHRGRRGHPWLLPRTYWPALLAQPPTRPLRAALQRLSAPQRRLPVPTPAIHWDLDTPADYAAQRPS